MTEPQLSRVSIVMAVYDRVDEIAAALDSVRAQSYPNIELIVIDGGSTDGTAELLQQRSAEIDVLRSEPDDGIYDAWNKGVALATGDWILFLGSDDAYASSSAVENLVAATTTAPGANLVVGRAALLLPGGRIGAKIGTAWSRRRMRLCMVVAHPATMTAAPLLREFGPFSTTVGVAADYDLYLRASNAICAADLDQVVVHFSVGGVTSTDVGRVLRSTRAVQAAYAPIGPVRAAAQYAGFRVALPIRQTLRRVRSRRVAT